MLTREETAANFGVLASYLVYGIECETRYRYIAAQDRGILTGLDVLKNSVKVKAEEGILWLMPDECIPVLYPFAALQKETAFSKPILKEIAQLFVGTANKITAGPYLYCSCADIELGSLTLTISTAEEDRLECTVWSDGTGEADGQPVQLSDILRRHHIAVGLEPEQYIEVFPSPSAPTTREKEEGGHE
jgi:hypothetical protein